MVHTDTPRPSVNTSTKRTSLRIKRLTTKADDERKRKDEDVENQAKIKKIKMESQREIRAIKSQAKEAFMTYFQRFQEKVQSKLDTKFKSSEKWKEVKRVQHQIEDICDEDDQECPRIVQAIDVREKIG